MRQARPKRNLNRRSGFFFKNKSAILLGAAEVFASAAFASRRLAALIMRSHNQPLLLALIVIAVFFALAAVFILIGRATTGLAREFHLSRESALRKLLVTLTPLMLLLLDFVQFKFVLRDISLTLIILAAAGILYLQVVLHQKLFHLYSSPLPPASPQTRQEPAQQRRILSAVFLASFATYSFILLSGIFPSLPFSGDEPHYLLTAKSMVRDRDINLYNNYRQKDYWEFYPGEINWHAYPSKRGPTHIYSKHFPALSLLLAPAYWLGDYLGRTLKFSGMNEANERNIRILLARETMALMAALLAAFFFLLVWECTQIRRTAFYAWFFFAFTPPLLFYSRLLYSEIPVALILLLVLRQTLFARPLSKRSLFWSGLGIAVMPWFGIKYIILAASIFTVFIYSQRRNIIMQRWKLSFFFMPLLFSAVMFLVFLWQVYGTFSPTAIYFGAAAAKVSPFHLNLKFSQVHFGARAIAYFLDQRMGLFIYSPFYILFIPGIFFMFKKDRKIGFSVLIPAVSYWILCSYLKSHGGFVPPERTLLPIAFILALFVSATLAWVKKRSALPLFRILAIFTILVAALAVARPRLFYHEGLSDDSQIEDARASVLTRLSNAGIDFSRLVPNLTSRPDFSWPVLLCWLALIAGISLAILKKEKSNAPPTDRLHLHALWTILLSCLVAGYSLFAVHLDEQNQLTVPNAKVYFQDGYSFGPELDGFWTRGNCRSEVVLKTSLPVKRLYLEMTSRNPVQVTVQIGSQRLECMSRHYAPLASAIAVPLPDSIPWQGSFLYLIRFEIHGGFVPHKMEASISDSRFLGLFVRLHPAFL